MLSQKYVLTIFHRYLIQNTSIRIPSEQKKIIPINHHLKVLNLLSTLQINQIHIFQTTR